MSIKSEPGYVRIKDRIPYHGKGVDDLSASLRKILTDNKNTQKVILEVGVPYIYIEKLVPEIEAVDLPKPVSLHEAIRSQRMEEYELEETSPFNQLWAIFRIIREEGLEVSAIAAGNKAKFQKWLGVRLHPSNMTIFETPFFRGRGTTRRRIYRLWRLYSDCRLR